MMLSMLLTSSETMLPQLLKVMEPVSLILKNQPPNFKHMLTFSTNKHYKNSLNSVNQLMKPPSNGMMLPLITIKQLLDLLTDQLVPKKETLDKE